MLEEFLANIRDVDVKVMRERDRAGQATALIDEFEAVQSKLRRAVATNGSGFVAELAAFIASPREAGESQSERVEAMWDLMNDLSKSALVGLVSKHYTAPARAVYQRAEGRADPDGWIKTPSIVVSWVYCVGQVGWRTQSQQPDLLTAR